MSDNVRALIAELRLGDGNGCKGPNDVMRRAADALESLDSAPPVSDDTEWEYGIHYEDDGSYRLLGSLERAQELASPAFGDVVVRRTPERIIPAGPWVAIEKGGK